MICDGAVDEVKCRAFLTTLTSLASQWFTSLSASSISSYSEIRELFLNEFTRSIDNTKHPINLLAIIQKPHETTRKYIERFNAECNNAECNTIDGLVDGVVSLCLTNDLANDEFRKQLTTKSGQGQTSHPRDSHRDNGPRGNPKPPRQNFDNYTPLVASITEIYHQVSEKGVLPKARPLKGRTQNAKNRSLICDYHQGYGHKTQDYYDLKDAIELAIRDGKLNEFI
ncbi:hypothetical protein PIB30_044147 [Stylosanthes scabra]|uniref:Retrotransposon gag domain-containing protein n=1 Tax=Stylosanthes scabra TaxID=79078 RepID=A0ABU6VGS0_9FABA|nr:hypothetical protein [Stylosanthes scabra]